MERKYPSSSFYFSYIHLSHIMSNKKNFANVLGIRPYDYDGFLLLEQSPVQRNHKKRAGEKKVFDKLSKLLPQHTMIATAELTCDAWDPVTGKQWYKGQVFLIDAHTRREFWKQGLSDFVPENLISQHYKVDSIEGVRDLYYTFDNSASAEKSSDLAYGACRYLNMSLKNTNLYQVTGLTWAAHYYNEKQFPKTGGYDGNGLIVIYGEFKKEILFLDSFAWETKKIDKFPHPLKTASLLFLKKHDNDIARSIVQRVYTNKFNLPDAENREDGVTELLNWVKHKDASFAANYDTIPVLTDGFLYWLNQAYLEQTGKKERLYKKGSSIGTVDKYVKIVEVNDYQVIDEVFNI